MPVLAAVSPAALMLLLPLAPSRISTGPPDSVVSVTVTVLLPAARSTVPKLLTPPRLNVPALVSARVLDAPLPMNVVLVSTEARASNVQAAPTSTITVPKLIKVVPSALSVPPPELGASSSVVLMPPPATVPPNAAPESRINRSVPLPKATAVAPPPLIVPALVTVPLAASGELSWRVPPASTESAAPLATLIDLAWKVSAPTSRTPPTAIAFVVV